jgi:hypothetical protein
LFVIGCFFSFAEAWMGWSGWTAHKVSIQGHVFHLVSMRARNPHNNGL